MTLVVYFKYQMDASVKYSAVITKQAQSDPRQLEGQSHELLRLMSSVKLLSSSVNVHPSLHGK